MQNIYDLIHTREREFQTIPVRVVEGYDFNQSETIRRINLYANSQFLDGNKDDLGEKIFFDITTPAVRNAAKNIDLDTKDVQFRAVNGKANYFKSWLYRRKAKDWMRTNGIARKFNEIPEDVSGVGSIVVKKVDSKRVFDFVDLRNLACDPSGKSPHPSSATTTAPPDSRSPDPSPAGVSSGPGRPAASQGKSHCRRCGTGY